MAVAVSEITLMAWVDVAEPGAQLAYHNGFLVVDTTVGRVSNVVEILWRRSPSIGIWT